MQAARDENRGGKGGKEGRKRERKTEGVGDQLKLSGRGPGFGPQL